MKNTGIYIRDEHIEKLETLRQALGVRSRNVVIMRLIEGARLTGMAEKEAVFVRRTLADTNLSVAQPEA